MGKHKIPARSLTRVAATVTAASAMAVFCHGVASAAPGDAPTTQGGVTTAPPATQGPLTSDAPTSQGELTTPAPTPQAPAERVYWTPPPAQYENTQWRTWDAYYEQNDTTAPTSTGQDTAEAAPAVYTQPVPDPAPLDVTRLHGPVPVDPTPPTQAPDRTVKVGDFYDDQPNWMSDNVRDRTNNSTAVTEAQVTDFWRSIGVPTDRAQRLAASQLALTAAGAGAGALAVGVPAAAGGALVGGTIGGILGAAAGTVVPIAPGIAPITSGVAGTAGGAALGAGVAGAAGAGLGVLGGGAAGFITGTAYGAGDLGEPTKVEIPEFDQPVITAQTEQVITAVENTPGGAETIATWTEPPTPADDARAFVAAQPGGDQVLGAVDQAAADIAASELAPAVDVIGDAIAAAFAPTIPA